MCLIDLSNNMLELNYTVTSHKTFSDSSKLENHILLKEILFFYQAWDK